MLICNIRARCNKKHNFYIYVPKSSETIRTVKISEGVGGEFFGEFFTNNGQGCCNND
jgi:hypothetical protein